MPAPLSWNEIKSRVLNFSRRWADAANEDSEAQPFWIEFFDCFGITNKRVFTFELNVKKHGGGAGFVDLLLNILESNICIEKLTFFYLSFYDILH